MTIITVKAAPGMRVPYENNARKYITEDKAVSVQESTYYLRRLADKDLVPCEAEPAADQTAPANTSPETDQAKAPAKPAADSTTADQVAPAESARARTTKNKGA
ncbi:hypothetical protein WJ974_00515 [Achromobacter xylosoxidans]